MIAIKMRFLAGRLHATPWGHHVNEGVVEYPPSLFRLLRSLVATARRACFGQVTEEDLRRIMLALRTPPSFHLPQAAIAHTRHYDQANEGVKFFDTFISIMPDDELIWFWSDVNLNDADRATLGKLLTSLGTFGRAESWCEASLVNEEETEKIFAVPNAVNSEPLVDPSDFGGKESIRLLLPQQELKPDDFMTVLETDTTAMRKKKQLEPTGARWLTYTRPSGILTPRRSRPSKTPSKVKAITVARYALDSTVLPLVQDCLPFGEQVRRALIRARDDTSHSEAITGKTVDGAPLKGHLHAHYLITDEDKDGRLDHVTIYAPREFDEEDLSALGRLSRIFRRGNRSDVRMVLIGIGARGDFHDVPIFRTSPRWVSIAPFSLPRFCSHGSKKKLRPRDLPEAQIERELSSRGLPLPTVTRRIQGYTPEGRPVVRWLEFQSVRFNGTRGRGLDGFELEFGEPVMGPIALGFACHFGLGLFIPR